MTMKIMLGITLLLAACVACGNSVPKTGPVPGTGPDPLDAQGIGHVTGAEDRCLRLLQPSALTGVDRPGGPRSEIRHMVCFNRRLGPLGRCVSLYSDSSNGVVDDRVIFIPHNIQTLGPTRCF